MVIRFFSDADMLINGILHKVRKRFRILFGNLPDPFINHDFVFLPRDVQSSDHTHGYVGILNRISPIATSTSFDISFVSNSTKITTSF